MNSRFLKRVLKILSWIVGILLLIYIILEITFQLNKSYIQHKIVSYLNEAQAGEIIVSSIDLSPLAHFPNMSVRLNDIKYYETKIPHRDINDEPFCILNKFYIGLDLLSLIRGNIDVSEVTLRDGNLKIITDIDSSLNVSNLIIAEDDSSEQANIDEDKEPGLRLNRVTLENIRISYQNRLNGYQVDLHVREFENLVTLIDRNLDIELHPQIDIVKIQKEDRVYLENTQLGMFLNFRFNLDSLVGQIDKSKLIVDGANLNIQGMFELKDDYYMDLKISSVLNDPSLLLLIFEDKLIKDNIENIQKGDIYFDGRIRGSMSEKHPLVDLKFGVNNMQFRIDAAAREINNFGFDGYLTLGTVGDYSDAIIRLANISSEGKAGLTTGDIEIRNFIQPEIDINMDANIFLSGIEQVFNFIKTPIYSGRAHIKARALASFDKSLNRLIHKEGEIDILIDDISFLVRNTGKKCDELSGHISWRESKILLENLTMKVPPTDISLSGQAENLINHLMGFDTNVKVDIRLKSDIFDFKSFLTDADVADWILDEYCRNVNIDLEFQTNSKLLRQVSELPSGSVKINKANLDLKNVSDIKIREAELAISPEKLAIKNIRTTIGENEVTFSGEIDNYEDLFANDFQEQCQISLDLTTDRIILKDFLTYKGENYLPEFWAETIYHDFYLDAILILPQESDSIQADFDFKINVKNLSSKNKQNGAIIKNVSGDVTDTGTDLLLNGISGNMGQTKFDDLDMNLIDLYSDDKPLRIKCYVRCNFLDVQEWLDYSLELDEIQNLAADTDTKIPKKYDVSTIPVLDLKAEIDEFCYGEFSLVNLKTTFLTQKENYLYLDPADSLWWIPEIDVTAQIDADTFKTSFSRVPDSRNKVVSRYGFLEIIPSYRGLFGAEGSGLIQVDLSKKRHDYHIKYAINNFKLETFLSRFGQQDRMTGIVHMAMDMKFSNDNLANLNGEVNLNGKDLTIYNIDLDEVLTQFKRTQSFNLVDVGAFMLAGPAGALITKASDYAVLLNVDSTKQTTIREFMSSWEVNGGGIYGR